MNQSEQEREDLSFGAVPVYQGPDGPKVLLVLHQAGHWSFPKGHPEEGETEVETIKRELSEETGIDRVDLITEKTFIENYSFEKDGVVYNKTVRYLIAEVEKTNNQTPAEFRAEIPKLEWLSPEQALNRLSYPEAKELLREVLDHLKEKQENLN